MEAEILVEVTRGPLVENKHRGHVAIVDRQGKLLFRAGDPYHKTFWRSSAKPVQALPVVQEGAVEHFGISPRELALFCASHNGEVFHTDAVKGIFAKLGLDYSLLQCGVHSPIHKETAKALILAGEEPSVLHSNCSGKHSGMLTLVAHLGLDLTTYLDLNHPLQQKILDYIADMTEYPRENIAIGIDGCGVPVHGLPLYNMALAYGRLAQPEGLGQERAKACKRITDAMLTYPEMVSGSQGFCTKLMQVGEGNIVAKGGAAGLYCVGIISKGIGIAVKCEDGSSRGREPVVVEVLRQLGYLAPHQVEALKDFHQPEIINHRGEVCGAVRPVVKLKTEG